MEYITRHIIRHEQTYGFTTCDFVLHAPDKKFWQGGLHENFYKLCRHLQDAFINGMPERDMSASQSARLIIKTKRIKGHEYSRMAKASAARGKGRGQHPAVQDYFMKNDRYAIGVEIPVWDDDMTALLDIVLVNPKTGIVRVLDYKPDASLEKKAATQVHHQVRLLCHNTGIDPKSVVGFYFDDLNTYQLT